MGYNEELPEGRKVRTFESDQEPNVVYDSGDVHVVYTPRSELDNDEE